MSSVYIRFKNSIDELDKIFRVLNRLPSRKKEIYSSSIIVKLHDQWNYRCRQIVLNNYGKSERKMLETLQSNWSNRRRMDKSWEPDWHIPGNTIRAASLLNVPDIIKIQNAIGAVTCIDDIRWTRNAIVHNVPVSFRKYKNMAFIKYAIRKVQPYEIIEQINPSTMNSIYEDWTEELCYAIKLAEI